VNLTVKNCQFNNTANGCSFLVSNNGYTPPDDAHLTITDNIFKNLKGTALLMTVGSSAGNSTATIVNNTVVNCRGGVNVTDPWDATVQNNVFVGTTNAVKTSGTLSRKVSYNCFYGNKTNFTGYPLTYGQTDKPHDEGIRMNDRRSFLGQLAGLAAATALKPAQALEAAETSSPPEPLPRIQIGKHRISRLVAGSNPILGYSYSGEHADLYEGLLHARAHGGVPPELRARGHHDPPVRRPRQIPMLDFGMPFFRDDPKAMTQVVRQVKQPCFGFKILASGRHCSNQQTVRAAFKFAFENIKPTDGVIVGMFPWFFDEVGANA